MNSIFINSTHNLGKMVEGRLNTDGKVEYNMPIVLFISFIKLDIVSINELTHFK